MKQDVELLHVPEWATDPRTWVCEALESLCRGPKELFGDGVDEIDRLVKERNRNK